MKQQYEITDEQLLFVLKDDYAYAYEVLYGRYSRLIYHWAQEGCRKHNKLLLADALQIARIAFYKAIVNYHAGDVSFINYAKHAVRYELLKEIRGLYKEKTISLDASVDSDGENENSFITLFASEDIFEPTKYIQIKEALDEMNHALSSLSEIEQEIWKLYCSGTSYKQIAEICNLSIKKVDNVILKLRNRFNKCIKEYI